MGGGEMIINDIKKAMDAVCNYKSPLEEIREEFNSGKIIKWLEKYSKKTLYSYDEWFVICKYLIDFWHITPDLHTLNQINIVSKSGISAEQLLKSFENNWRNK